MSVESMLEAPPYRDVFVSHHWDQPRQKADENCPPGLDHHVRHRAYCHAPSQSSILDMSLRKEKNYKNAAPKET